MRDGGTVGGHGERSGTGGIGRRRFLIGAAGVSAAAWVAPAIITMDPAGAAELTSPPPKPPDTVSAQTVEVPGAQVKPDAEVSGATDDGGRLPFTGANLEQLTIAGLAATAAGAAMHFWSARTGLAGTNPADRPPG